MSKHHKWARIIRFVDLAAMPAGMAATYDREKNLVRIDRELFETLDANEKGWLMFTEEDVQFKV